jgi:hypothetical protein
MASNVCGVSDTNEPTGSIGKAGDLLDCACSACPSECVELCEVNMPPTNAACELCQSANCSAELAACNADDGS